MPVYALDTVTRLPIDPGPVFAFFGDARNLNRITPPWLRFKIHGDGPFAVRPGTCIDYSLRLHGMPFAWRTEITVWDPPHQFVDEQRQGPYHWWIHTHTFTPVDGGTEMADEVRYCPRGGALPHWLFVRRELRRIFTYRHRALHDALSLPPPTDSARVRIGRAW
jgi:ligand-binding SRPBCC domain-containing protein